MPASKRAKPLYQRGDFKLYPREGRNHEIVWYDAERKRERSVSAGTIDIGKAKLALDRQFLKSSGARHCPTCHRPWDADESPYLATAIADYLLLSEEKAGYQSAKYRLAHVSDYLVDRAETRCADVDERWIEAFRQWLLAKPVVSPKGLHTRPRTIGSVEGSVLQLAAAINATPGQTAKFKPMQAKDVSKSPTFRADIKMLGAMFRFALAKEQRVNLLRYLRMAVATWARPDAIFECKADQWHSAAHVLDMNIVGRRQTKKHRPKIPVPKQFMPHLDSGDAFMPVSMVRSMWSRMRTDLGLPLGRETGEKLIRRSVSTIARKRIGEANWVQGQMMLGHVKHSVSDIYAIPDPANLGLALAATEAIIDEIEALAPGAFSRRAGAANVVEIGAVRVR